MSLLFPVMIQKEYAGLCPQSFQGMGERKGGVCSFQEKAKNVKIYSIALLQQAKDLYFFFLIFFFFFLFSICLQSFSFLLAFRVTLSGMFNKTTCNIFTLCFPRWSSFSLHFSVSCIPSACLQKPDTCSCFSLGACASVDTSALK